MNGLPLLVNREDRLYLDEDNWEYAASQGRVLYTCSISDFYEMHTSWLDTGRSHAGLILCQQRHAVSEQLHRLPKLIATHSAEGMVHRAEFSALGPESFVRG